jgi:DTW domain-containing protein YfiP
MRACLCSWIRPTQNQIPVLVLQHPAEAGHAKGSARLLRLSLLDCHCAVGDVFDPEALQGWLSPDTALLYPATHNTARGVESPPPIRRLVVLDGTWRQSGQLLRQNPWLQALPRLPLQDPPPSQYGVRKAQRPEQRSTLEATCLALGQLEARPAHYTPLLQAFAGWVHTLQPDPLTA